MSAEVWPLEGIRLKTIIKITACDVYHHEDENPYYQISIDGFILSSYGDVMLANVQINVEEEHSANVNGIVEAYMPDSIHWLECSTFCIIRGEYHFYEPSMKVVDATLETEINEFYPILVSREREADEGEFWYAGTVYVPGKGDMAYGNLPWVAQH